jgi:serine phosphatase RsbU (regulator of sigma subunit)
VFITTTNKILKNFFATYLLLFYTLLSTLNASAQQKEGDAKLKAQFIYGFTKYIQWENQDKLDVFSIAILGKDSIFFSELNKYFENRTFGNKKPFIIKQYEKIEDFSKVQILYVNRKSGFEIDKVLKKISGYGTLLVSENYPFQSSMINFVQVANAMRFELNQKRIEEEGMKIRPELLQEAITSAEEWQKYYFKMEDLFKSEKEKVEVQKEELVEMRDKYRKQKEEIEQANKLIDEQKQQMKEQQREISRQKTELNQLIAENEIQQKNLEEKIATLKQQETEINTQKNEIKKRKEEMQKQEEILAGQKKSIVEQEEKIESQKSILSEQLSLIQTQKLILFLIAALLLVIVGFGLVLYRNYKEKKQINKQLEKQNIAITDSITYAKRIQQATLVSNEYLDKVFSEYFVLLKPRDIVSGDFYWAYETPDKLKTIFAVVDCTGHGVPGAFMSMIGNSLLNEVVSENKITEADKILDHLKQRIIQALKQTGAEDETKDSMDLSLCVWNKNTHVLDFSGAYNPIYLVRNGELTEYKANRQTVGFQLGKNEPFIKHSIKIENNDSVYLFSDGYADQKGGEKGRKFYYSSLKEIIKKAAGKEMAEQRTIIKDAFYQWKGDFAQLDDVCIMGVRFTIT